MFSMTGYGKSDINLLGREIIIEIKSVNNRFLDINCKYPRSFVAFDDKIRKAVQKKVSRGRIEIFITYNDNRQCDRNVSVDMNLARGLITASKDLIKEFPDIENDLSLSNLLRYPDLIKVDSNEDDLEAIEKLLDKCLNDALDNLNNMRKIEADKLEKDSLERLVIIEDDLNQIAEKAPKVAEEYRLKLRQKIEDYLNGVEIDEARILNETAFFADKSSIDEEITRLKSHIGQFRTIIKSEGAGRKLDFLIQEFNRETNTICSKSNDLEITGLGLNLKSEIEKIREQVQNLE